MSQVSQCSVGQLLTFLLLFAIQILNIHAIHTCIHDTIHKQQELKQINVPYENHPYAINEINNEHNTRRLLSPSSTSPIRISAYYDPATISTTFLTTNDIDFIKSLVSATIRYYNKFVSVIPVSGRFYVSRCSRWFYTSFPDVVNCVNYTQTVQCGQVTIPAEHYGDDYLYFYPTNYSATKISGGKGILNTDLMLYVSYSNNSCGASTLAYAASCDQDQYGRPVVGYVNICPNMLSGNRYWKEDLTTMVHEVAHVLVMSFGLWSSFRDSNGDEIPQANVVEYDSMSDQLYYIISPNVKQLARNHFNCPTLAGLPLENNGGQGSALSHWDEKYLKTALMTARGSGGLTYFTDFTAALMDDSGWYIVDYNYSEKYYFGKNAGCELWNDKCVNPTTHVTNFDQFFCDGFFDHGCNYNYIAPAYCSIGTYGDSLDSQYQYFSDPTLGGSQYADYCPFRNPSITNNDYESVCWDIRGNTFTSDTYTSQNYAINSRCVDINDNGNDNGFCFEHQCFGYDTINKQWDGVSIKISSTQNINCTRTDQPGYTTSTTKTASSITADIKCPNIDAICGSSSQPFACYWGNYNDDVSQCICSPGYTGTDCNTEDTLIEPDAQIPPGTEPTPPPTTPLSTTLCVEGRVGAGSIINNEYTYKDVYDFYSSWKVTTQNLYVSWSIFRHSWFIAPTLDALTYYAFCNVSAWTEDITQCHGNWYVYDGVIDKMVLDTNVVAYMGTCGNQVSHPPSKYPTTTPTDSPSKQPTQSPSKAPTFTVSPTKFPTRAPTIPGYTYPPSKTPSKTPTQTPTKTPSKTPSKSPSKFPTLNPSITPTKVPSMSPTKYPSQFPSIPPSKYPSISPSTPSEQPSISPSDIPTVSPTKLVFRREFSIELEYNFTNENVGCNFSLFINEISTFRIAALNSFIFDIDELYIVNDVNESLIEINYKVSTNVSDEMLDQIETMIDGNKYKQLLINDLESTFNCINFEFIGFVTTMDTTTTNALTEETGDSDNDDEIKLLDWKNYNTMEMAIVGGIALVGLILFCVIFYCFVKKCCCDGRESGRKFTHNSDAKTMVEFNGFQSKPRQKKAVFSDEFLDVNNQNIQSSNRRASDGSQWLEI